MTGNERGAPGRHGHASAHEVHTARGGPAVTPAVPSPVSLPLRLAATKAGGVQATGPGGGPSPPGHGLPPGRTPPGASHAEPVSRPISATVTYAEDGLLSSSPARGGRQRLSQRPPPPVPRSAVSAWSFPYALCIRLTRFFKTEGRSHRLHQEALPPRALPLQGVPRPLGHLVPSESSVCVHLS